MRDVLTDVPPRVVERRPALGTIRAVVLDTVGTTVQLEGAFETALIEALDEVGADPGAPDARARRFSLYTLAGCPTVGMFGLFLGDDDRARWAHRIFEAAFVASLVQGNVEPAPGALFAIRALRCAGIRVCLATSLDGPLTEQLVEALGWNGELDAVLPEQVGMRRRPYPDELMAAARHLDLDDPSQLAVAGDTVGDLVAGTRAGAGVVAGVLGGAHGLDELLVAPHTHVLPDVRALPDVLVR
jgi:phosphonatase-like hydrolase